MTCSFDLRMKFNVLTSLLKCAVLTFHSRECNSTAVVAAVAMYYNHVLQYTMQDEYLTVWHGILSNQYENIMFNYNDDSQARAEDYTLVKNLICIYFLRGSDASFWNT